ncbi:MAG: NlpC/P60 family protein [Epsilonproteobacteria bacterium]|nr:NlpC/P60 family protein [Campylobacterota bacterium]
MKTIVLFFAFVIVSSLSSTAQANQKKKILTLFDTEQTIETPKKKQPTKLIKLFDSVPNQPLPEYKSVTLQKYYTKEQDKVKEEKILEPKTTVNNLPFNIPTERLPEPKTKEIKSNAPTPFSTINTVAQDEVLSEEELDRINSEIVTTTTLANLFGDEKDDEIEQFPKGSNYYDKITKMVRKAFSLVGSAYKFGASAGGNTYDCSLFTQTIFRKIGLHLPRSSIEQATIGTKVSRKNLIVGDLLFFKTYRKSPSHVGIYIGDNKMIHASTQKGVTIDDIDENYYKKRYLFAKRPSFESKK